MTLKKYLVIVLLGATLPSGSGCAALLIGGGAGAGTVAYLKGELRSTEDALIDITYEAAQKALKDLDFVITSKQNDAFSAKLIAYRANDKKIEIYFQKASEKTTEVRIRVGVFGDESLSLMILERLRKYL